MEGGCPFLLQPLGLQGLSAGLGPSLRDNDDWRAPLWPWFLATSGHCLPSGDRLHALPLSTPETWLFLCSHRPMDPVLKAIKEGNEEALKAMIKDGKNLGQPNKEGWLPLHEAAYYGQLGCLKVLQRGEASGGKGPGQRQAETLQLSSEQLQSPNWERESDLSPPHPSLHPLLPSFQASQDRRA